MEKEIRPGSRIDKLIFYYVDGRDFLKIYDKRDTSNIRTFDLNEIEREILISCIDVISLQELQGFFPHISTDQLISILTVFKTKGFVFEEDDHYLALPLRNAVIKIFGNIQLYSV